TSALIGADFLAEISRLLAPARSLDSTPVGGHGRDPYVRRVVGHATATCARNRIASRARSASARERRSSKAIFRHRRNPDETHYAPAGERNSSAGLQASESCGR